MTSGIYQIVGPHDRCYIGRSEWIEQRWIMHISDLRMKRHGNWKLQAVYNTYGIKVFKFKILEVIINLKLLKSREASYIRKYWGKCYNIADESEHFSQTDFVEVAYSKVKESIEGTKLKPYSNIPVRISSTDSLLERDWMEERKLLLESKGLVVKIPYGMHYGKLGTIVSVYRKLVKIKISDTVFIELSVSSIMPQILVDNA